MAEILELLRHTARARSGECDVANFMLRGMWRTEYFLRLTEDETLFHLHYLIAQTLGQGCCYYDPAEEEPGLGDFLIGKNVLEMEPECRSVSIAILDAAFAALKGPPAESVVLNGTNMEKAATRAQLVCDEATALLGQRQAKHGTEKTVAVIGVVGSVLASLSGDEDLRVTASDFERRIVDRHVHGVRVRHGSKSPDLVAESDVAVVTGMTLATNTLDDILITAQEYGTALLVYAETGANFASEYCDMGVDIVVSEPFPFYLTCAGPTQIDVYRRPTTRST